MTESDSVVLGRYFHAWEAEIVRGVLESAGLKCIITPHADGLGGAITDTSTGFRVLVNADELDLARQAIEDARQEGKELPKADAEPGE